MFCTKCGKEVKDGMKFCANCGNPVENVQEVTEVKNTGSTKRDVPKCTHCGYEGQWKVGPLLRPIDFIIGIIFLIFGVVPGLIYIGVVAAIRSNEDNREKICPKCNSKNLWTFFY